MSKCLTDVCTLYWAARKTFELPLQSQPLALVNLNHVFSSFYHFSFSSLSESATAMFFSSLFILFPQACLSLQLLGKFLKLLKLFNWQGFVQFSFLHLCSHLLVQIALCLWQLTNRACCHEAIFFQKLWVGCFFAAFLCTEMAQKIWKKSVDVFLAGNWFEK